MMSLALLVLAPLPELPPMLRVARPGTQNCPDGSVVAATDSCPLGLPDHRYLLTHEPRQKELGERWWCGSAKEPIEARITVELKQPDASRKNPYYVSRLSHLSINGQKPSARLLQEVRSKVERFGWVTRINTRCLNTPSHGVIGVLSVNDWNGYEQRSEIELRP